MKQQAEFRVCPKCHTKNRLNAGWLLNARCGACHHRLDSTYYDILGISRSSRANEIKASYRKLVNRWHPDKNLTNPYATRIFIAIRAAYNVLSDPEKRGVYDKTLGPTSPSTGWQEEKSASEAEQHRTQQQQTQQKKDPTNPKAGQPVWDDKDIWLQMAATFTLTVVLFGGSLALWIRFVAN